MDSRPKRHALHPKTVDKIGLTLNDLRMHYAEFDKWEISFFTNIDSWHHRYKYKLLLSDSQLEWLQNMERKYIPRG